MDYIAYQEGLKQLIQVPHVRSTAMEYGGLIVRLAKEYIPSIESILLGPGKGVYTEGHCITVASNWPVHLREYVLSLHKLNLVCGAYFCNMGTYKA